MARFCDDEEGFDPEAELAMMFPDGIDDGVSLDTIFEE